MGDLARNLFRNVSFVSLSCLFYTRHDRTKRQPGTVDFCLIYCSLFLCIQFIQAGRNGTQRTQVREESARAARQCVRARACVWSKGRREEGVKPLPRGLLQRNPERRPGRPRSKSRGIRRREGWVEHRARRLERRPRRREGNKYEQGKVVGAFRERPRTAKAATKLVCSRPDLTTTPFSLLLSLDFDRV